MPPGGGDKEQRFSIYDGKRFVFSQSSWQLVTLYRMLRRWGLSYFTFKAAPEEMLTRFLSIYDRQVSATCRPAHLQTLCFSKSGQSRL